MVNKKLLRPVLLLVIVGGLAFGLWWWQGRSTQQETGHLTLYGNTDIREARLTFNASEHIREMRVQEGDRVERGQVLARLDSSLLQLQVAVAAARREAQQQVLTRLLAGSRPEEIRQAQANLDAAKAKAHAAQLTYQRLNKLLPRKLASPEDVDDARAAADAAAGAQQAAEQALALAVAGPRQEDIAQARAQLASLDAELALARQHLEDATLRAPADGVIRERILEPGDMVTPQTPVFTLALADPVWIRAYLPEPDLGRVAPGMQVSVTSDSFPGKRYRGWVGYISPTAEFTPKNVETPQLRTRLVYQLRAFVCNPQDELRLGMPATVSIDLRQPGPGPAKHRCGDQ